MGFGASKFLGLAIKDRSILAAELRLSGSSRTVTHAAEFVLPAELSWDKPEGLGTALRHFLRQNHFSASSAVVGVPAKWLMAREKEVPPATAAVAASALRLQAERIFSLEARDLIFDYAGESHPRESRRVLIMAMLRPHVERIERMTDTAGLRAVAITSATLALAAAAAQSPATGSSLVLAQDAAELLIRDGGVPRMLKYLPVSGLTGDGENGGAAACLAALGTEVRRAVTLLPMGSGPLRSLDLWDSVGLDAAQAGSMGERTGLDIRRGGELSLLGMTSSNGSSDAGRFGAAAALALAGAQPELRGIDFLHSRLAPAKARRIGRGTMLGGMAAAAVVLGLGYLYFDLRRQQGVLDGIETQLSAIKPQQQTAEEIKTRVETANKWYQVGRPPYLGCLKEVTRAFPDEGSIWASSVTLRENRQGTLTGHAQDERSIRRVLGELKANAVFADVKQKDFHVEGGKTPVIVFTITFTYKPEKE